MSPRKSTSPTSKSYSPLSPLTPHERERLRRAFKGAVLEAIEKTVIVEINPLLADQGFEVLGALNRLREGLHRGGLTIRIDDEDGVVISNGAYQLQI